MAAAGVRCESCGEEIRLDSVRFCPFCGSQVQRGPGERRKAIIVFADISGFTQWSQKVDPDTLRTLTDQLMQQFSASVRRRGGVVDKIIGDSILFVFGAHQASVDDPMNTLQTVEDLRQVTREFSQSQKLSLDLHFGIAYGVVSVGVVGPRETIMGDPVNLASRLLSVAKPGEIVVSEEFRELFGKDAEFDRLPPVELKGIAGPVQTYRYIASGSFRTTPNIFLGRESEIARIDDLLKALAERKQGHQLMISGPAGIGKTTLVSAGLRRAAEMSIRNLTLKFEGGGSTVLRPYVNLAGSMLDQLREDPAYELWQNLIRSSGSMESVNPKQLEALIAELLFELIREGPMLFMAEDLHLAEPSAKLLYANLLQRFSCAAVLFVTTSRTAENAFGTAMELPPFSLAHSWELFRATLGEEGDSETVQRELLSKCEGNPFFITEAARAAARGVPNNKLFSGNIEFLLSSVLDSFEAKDQERIKKAAVWGSRISVARLARLWEEDAERVRTFLSSTHIFQPSAETDSYIFRHSLLRESAYERINSSTRETWHERAGSILEEDGASPEEIAFHFVRSKATDQALKWSCAAGKQLAHFPRQEEALYFLKQAWKLALETENEGVLLELLPIRFDVETRGRSVADALALLEEWQRDDTMHAYPWKPTAFMYIKALLYFERGLDADAARELSSVKSASERPYEIETDLLQGKVLARLGRHSEAVRTAMKTLRTENLSPAMYGELFNLLGYVSYLDRELEQADEFYRKSLEKYETAQDRKRMQKALQNLGNVAFLEDRYDLARSRYTQAVDLGFRLGDLVGYCDGLLRLVSANFRILKFRASVANCRRGMRILGHGLHSRLMQDYLLTLGPIYLYLGDLGEADAIGRDLSGRLSPSSSPEERGRVHSFFAGLRMEQGRMVEAMESAKESVKLLTGQSQHADALLGLAGIQERTGDTSGMRTTLSEIQNALRGKFTSQFIRSKLLVLESRSLERKSPDKLNEIRTFIESTRERPLLTRRLPLLVELLEYGPNPTVEAEASALAAQILGAFPAEYRPNFESKGYVTRLRQLTGAASISA